MRTVLIGLVIVMLILSCGLAIRYSQDASFAEGQLNKERYKRLVAEENLQKLTVQNNSLKGKLKTAQDKVAQVETAFERAKTINEDLKMRLDKAAEIKANLEKKVEEMQKLVLPM